MNVRRLFPFALFALLFATAVKPTIDPDMWWHLETGESILTGGIPRVDTFSFTHTGEPWLAHEWLTDAAMWWLHGLVGLPGLMLVFAAVTTATWWLVYVLCDAKPYVAGLVVAAMAKASELVWGVRPQLFNLLFLALFLYLVEMRRQQRLGQWVYVAFPTVTLLWANMHSGFLLGIVLLGAYLVGDLLGGRIGLGDEHALPGGELRLLGGAILASAAVSLLNPRGIELLVFPFVNLASPVQRELITEWFPPAPHQFVFWFLVGVLVVEAAVLVLTSARASLTELLILGGTAGGAFLSVRNIPVFAIASAPIVARHLARALPWQRIGDRSGSRDSAAATVGGAVALGVAAAAMAAATLAGNEARVKEVFPVAAVDWMQVRGLDSARIFNAYNFGGYLIWRGIPVYVDGRADLYGDDGLEEFVTTYFAGPDWEQPLERYEVDVILTEVDSALAAVARSSDSWEVVYEDEVAVVLTDAATAAAGRGD